MWLLMQFAVMGLYWDIPPLGSVPEEHTPLTEVRGEDEELLMSLEDEDGAAEIDLYGSVNPDQTETQLSSESPSPPPATSDPFANFSASHGEGHSFVLGVLFFGKAVLNVCSGLILSVLNLNVLI